MSLSFKLVFAVCGKYSPVAENLSQGLGFRHPLRACPYASKCVRSYYHWRSESIFMLVRFTCVFLLMLSNCGFKKQIRRLGYWLQNWKATVMQSVWHLPGSILSITHILCVLLEEDAVEATQRHSINPKASFLKSSLDHARETCDFPSAVPKELFMAATFLCSGWNPELLLLLRLFFTRPMLLINSRGLGELPLLGICTPVEFLLPKSHPSTLGNIPAQYFSRQLQQFYKSYMIRNIHLKVVNRQLLKLLISVYY